MSTHLLNMVSRFWSNNLKNKKELHILIGHHLIFLLYLMKKYLLLETTAKHIGFGKKKRYKISTISKMSKMGINF